MQTQAGSFTLFAFPLKRSFDKFGRDGWFRGGALSRINKTNLKKTVYYLKRNGLLKTWYAVRERLDEKRRLPYSWTSPSEEELEQQRSQWEREGYSVTFSILVPAYRTRENHLIEMIQSVRSQTYPKWELILADATEDDSVERVAKTAADARVRYIRLEKNEGIAENTNQALSFATGDYVGLLDHDDLLTENALYEVAARIERGRQRGCVPEMLYSDEDKCNGDRTEYFEPNWKEDFNLDLLLSNNYICHFLVMKRELIQRLKFRAEYDGAQDYDLVLRAASELMEKEDAIVHIPRVLYHWRCHDSSTAENPQSKIYAYEAGRRAIQDFADSHNWHAKAADTAHVGFYTLQYAGNLFESRKDIGAIGGRLTCRGRVISGRLTEEGKAVYENLPVNYSGYLHRARLPQNAAAVDIRNVRVRPECRKLFEKVTGIPYRTIQGTDVLDVSSLPENTDWQDVSLNLCRALKSAGYRILYLPERRNDRKYSAGWK